MRFHGEHIGTVLPYLFEKYEDNLKFIEDQTLMTKMGNIFDDTIVDNTFNRLYNVVNTEAPTENIITKEPHPGRYLIHQPGIYLYVIIIYTFCDLNCYLINTNHSNEAV